MSNRITSVAEAQHAMRAVCGTLPDVIYFLCETVIQSEQFLLAPGSAGKHQAFAGGLAMHTAEVLLNCESMAATTVTAYNKQIPDRTVLFTAAIWHDFHKIHEYEIVGTSGDEHDPGPTEKIIKLPYRNTIGHVVGSTIALRDAAGHRGIPNEWIEKVMHCMLAHHGRLEWRSPVEPQSMEAFILHAADMLSARSEE